MSSARLLQTTEVVQIPIDKIRPNLYQPRKFFEHEQLQDLADSIKEYGVLQPVSVRYINNVAYELVAGERRLRASKLAGLLTIPAIIVNLTDQDSAVLALIENLQRQDLHYLEEAEGFQNLMLDYHFTQEQIARKVGKNQSTVANKLRILRLPADIKKTLQENNLSERHARALLKFEQKGLDGLEIEKLQREVVAKIAKDDLTVKRTEDLIDIILANLQKEQPITQKQHVKSYIKDIRLFTNTIKQAVDIMNSAGVVTDYETEETADGCFISIMVSYNNN